MKRNDAWMADIIPSLPVNGSTSYKKMEDVNPATLSCRYYSMWYSIFFLPVYITRSLRIVTNSAISKSRNFALISIGEIKEKKGRIEGRAKKSQQWERKSG